MMVSEIWLLSRALTEGNFASVSLHVDLRTDLGLLFKGFCNYVMNFIACVF